MRNTLYHAACLAALSLVASVCWPAQASSLPPPLEAKARPVKQLTRVAVQAMARAGDRLVAVGERGVVLLSDDEGRHWRQASVPVSVTLTSLAFVDDKIGWAVGHGGVVLHSIDAGATWSKQIDGAGLAKIAV